jgi:hypothetical protein
MFENLPNDTLILQVNGVAVPACNARLYQMDLKSRGIKKPDWALASLCVLANLGRIISPEMLEAALAVRFKGRTLAHCLQLVNRVKSGQRV